MPNLLEFCTSLRTFLPQLVLPLKPFGKDVYGTQNEAHLQLRLD